MAASVAASWSPTISGSSVSASLARFHWTITGWLP